MRTTVILLAMLVSAAPAFAGETTVMLAIKNMVCATCPITVRAAIAKVPGVKSVTVDFQTKAATVVFDNTIVAVETLSDASRNAGFPAERKE